MTTLSAIIVVTAGKVEHGNRVFEAFGWGYPAFTRQASPTGLAPATHWLLSSLIDPATDAILRAMMGGALPIHTAQGDPIAWGQGDTISQSDALAAVSGGAMTMLSDGPVKDEAHLDSTVTPAANFATALDKRGLTAIEPEI